MLNDVYIDIAKCIIVQNTSKTYHHILFIQKESSGGRQISKIYASFFNAKGGNVVAWVIK